MAEKHRQRLLLAAILIGSLLLGCAMIQYSAEISVAVYNSIYSCFTVIIPSLYGFMVLSGFLVSTNAYIFLSRPFSFLARRIFKIPAELFSVFLISQFAGYPVGAKLLYALLEQEKISKKDAETMLCTCYCSSPTFVVGLVGVQLFSSVEIGLLIYLSLVLTNFLLAILTGFFRKTPPETKPSAAIKLNAQILIESVESGAKALFQVCMMIVFFSILISILNGTGVLRLCGEGIGLLFHLDTKSSVHFVSSLLEISGVTQLPKLCYPYLPVLTGIFSFGGVCIVAQIIALTKGKIRFVKFILCRLVSAFLAAGISGLLFHIFEANLALSATTHPSLGIRSVSPIPSVFLIVMTVLLLSRNSGKEAFAK